MKYRLDTIKMKIEELPDGVYRIPYGKRPLDPLVFDKREDAEEYLIEILEREDVQYCEKAE